MFITFLNGTVINTKYIVMIEKNVNTNSQKYPYIISFLNQSQIYLDEEEYQYFKAKGGI